MLARLLEADYFRGRDHPSEEHVSFWLLELRSPALLIEAAERFALECHQMCNRRPLLRMAIARDEAALRDALHHEAERERQADRDCWRPLRAELERLRRDRRGS